MYAVKILHDVEKFFDRNHNFFCLWGGLFAALFFGLFVPYNIYDRMHEKWEQQVLANNLLESEMQEMNNRLKFFELPYEKRKKVMREVECLAKNIYFEAGGEPHSGKIAVAEVTMNRVKSKRYPRTVCGVVYQKTKGTCQFSWVCERGKVVSYNRSWDESIKIAENILISKRNYGIIGNATYFHADYVEPQWAETKEFVKQIGRHLFYKG
jgi:spore germination cell wall hydrolase CwlJ-like protein